MDNVSEQKKKNAPEAKGASVLMNPIIWLVPQLWRYHMTGLLGIY